MYKLIAFDPGNALGSGYGVFESPIFIVQKAQLILLNALETSKVAWKEEEQMSSFQVLPFKPVKFNLQPVNCGAIYNLINSDPLM